MKRTSILTAVACGLGLLCGSSFRSQAAVPPAVAAYQASVVATPGLIPYYEFDAGNANDNFGINNGTLQGTAGFANGIGGGADQALNLDGLGWDNLGAVPPLSFTSQTGTVEMWVKAGWETVAGATPAYVMAASYGPTSYQPNYTISMYSDRSAILLWGGVYDVVGIPNPGTNWHHVAIVFAPGTWTVIWDGVSLGTRPATTWLSDVNTVQLGAILPSGGAGGVTQTNWVGELDEVAFYSTSLSLSSVQAHRAAFTSYVPPVPQPVADYQAAVTAEASLISYYTFDASNADDDIGANNGTLQGTAGFANGIGGGADKALNLDINGWDNLGSVPPLSFTSQTGTIEMWVKAGWTPAAATPLYTIASSFGPTSWAPNYTVSMSGDKASILLWNAEYHPVAIPNPGTSWHHLAVVFAPGTETLIWDGVNLATIATGAWNSGANTVQLGGMLPSGGLDWANQTNWVGELDEVAFYSTSLSLSSIQAHRAAFTSYVPPIPPAVTAYQAAVTNTPGLISYYKFDGSNADDNFGSNNGTLAGTNGFAGGFVNGFGGGLDQALNLDGSSYSQLGAVPALNFASGTGTVEMWVQATWTNTPTTSVTLVGNFQDASPWVQYTIALAADKSAVVFWNNVVWKSFPLPINAGTSWHHVGVVFDAGNWKIVWDGQDLGDIATGWNGLSGVGWTTIGADSPNGASLSTPWIGNLDEVAFYSTALPVSSFQAHYVASGHSLETTPAIVIQPVGGILPVGEHFQMSGSGTGGNLSYAWRKNGTVIPGATNSTYDIPSTSAADTGAYQLVVANLAGSAVSAMAQVNVLAVNLASYQQKVTSEPSLISYYKFDNSTANDYVGSNHGTLTGTTAFDASFGGVGNLSLDLGNQNSYGWDEVGNVPAFHFSSGSGTVECWLRCNWTNGTYETSSDPVLTGFNPGIICDREQDVAENWGVFIYSDKSGLFMWNGGSLGFHTVALPVSAGDSWHHLATVFSPANSGSISLIWDGKLLTTFTNSPMGGNTGSTMHIGATASWGRGAFLGNLDEVAFYSDALSTSAIQDHVRAAYGLGSQPVISTTRAGNYVALSWVDPGNWVLESTAQLSPASWTPVQTNGSPVVIQTDGNKFFRLKAQ